jgi:hypothetical protein
MLRCGGDVRLARGYVLVLGLVFGIMLGASVALSGVNASVTTAAVSLFVGDATAQTTADCDTGDLGGIGCITANTDSDNGDGDDGGHEAKGGDSGTGGDATGGDNFALGDLSVSLPVPLIA